MHNLFVIITQFHNCYESNTIIIIYQRWNSSFLSSSFFFFMCWVFFSYCHYPQMYSLCLNEFELKLTYLPCWWPRAEKCHLHNIIYTRALIFLFTSFFVKLFQVSWKRLENYTLLTVGSARYTASNRYVPEQVKTQNTQVCYYFKFYNDHFLLFS